MVPELPGLAPPAGHALGNGRAARADRVGGDLPGREHGAPSLREHRWKHGERGAGSLRGGDELARVPPMRCAAPNPRVRPDPGRESADPDATADPVREVPRQRRERHGGGRRTERRSGADPRAPGTWLAAGLPGLGAPARRALRKRRAARAGAVQSDPRRPEDGAPAVRERRRERRDPGARGLRCRDELAHVVRVRRAGAKARVRAHAERERHDTKPIRDAVRAMPPGRDARRNRKGGSER